MLLFNLAGLNKIRQSAKKTHGQVEVGGLLLGYRKSDDIQITEFTVPKKKDISKPYSFERCDPTHQWIATYHWYRSRFTCDWVGEWHTHPEPHPTPSHIDISSWRDQVIDRNAEMCYVILGLQSDWIGTLKPHDNLPIRLTTLDILENSMLAQ